MNTLIKRISAIYFSLALLVQPAAAQTESLSDSVYESKFVEARGIQLHYLDFGGTGLPLLFIHGAHGDAGNFTEFAPRFSDGYRVFAVTRRGWGESEDIGWGYDVATQAEDIAGFLDTLGIKRAVLAGNVGGASQIMIYLAEHHPERLEGLVFLAHSPQPPDLIRDPSSRTLWEMFVRTANDLGDRALQLQMPRFTYRPLFFHDESARIGIPALSFVNPDGRRYPPDFDILSMILAGIDHIADPVAREYFAAMVQDEELRAGARELLDKAEAMSDEFQQSFERAFGSSLRLVSLEVPAVSGYEYEQAPDLIYPHLRRFLETLGTDKPAGSTDRQPDNQP